MGREQTQSYHHSTMPPRLHALLSRTDPALFFITEAASVTENTLPHTVLRCLTDTHLPLCMQQQLPNSTAARMKEHGGNGLKGSFLICIVFEIQLKIPENSGGEG